ncbi:response regulator transcription factor [Bryobacter aggregatus]|uniref:response regulator n=1 Tax=Bryobacter aggregatus TaxID=360054 RepID=UPI0004E23F34|nr:response regulator transcription factor [Bryobacter aggregatus]
MAIKVLIVDDHKIMRDGIKAILKAASDIEVVGETDSGVDAVQMVRKLRPDVVLMDINLQGMSGIEATIEMLRYNPDTRVMMLSMYDDEHSVISAVKAGARGFVLKRASDGDLVQALRTVAQGGSYLSPRVSDRLLDRIQKGTVHESTQAAPLADLSPREIQVLRLVAEGKTSKEIAVMLDLSVQTIRSYRKAMMKKLNLNNVAGLTQLALATGLTRPQTFLQPGEIS